MLLLMVSCCCYAETRSFVQPAYHVLPPIAGVEASVAACAMHGGASSFWDSVQACGSSMYSVLLVPQWRH